MGGRRLRVAVCSEQDIVRAGVETLLSDFSECVEVVPAYDGSDVLLYDALGLSNGNGHDLDHAVQRLPGRVVALARDLEPGLGAQAMSRGAVASVSIGASGRELLGVLLAAANGHLRNRNQSAPDPADAESEGLLGEDVQLTEREHQVLALIVGGASNKQVAAELYLTINTVKSVIRSTYARIGVTSRSQAVAWGIDHGVRSHTVRS